jgi:hypothetical protein
MNIIGAIASGVIGAVAVAVAILLLRHADKFPAKAHPWARRFAIIIMWAAGAVFAATGLESVLVRVIVAVTGFIGGQYQPIIHAGIIIGALFLVVGTLAALIWDPDDAAAFTAIAVPLVLGLVAGGALHGLYAATVEPGQQLASAINSWLAG